MVKVKLEPIKNKTNRFESKIHISLRRIQGSVDALLFNNKKGDVNWQVVIWVGAIITLVAIVGLMLFFWPEVEAMVHDAARMIGP